VRVVFPPVQKADFAQRADQMGGLTAAHVLDHFLHLIALEVAANAVVHFAAGLYSSRVLKL